MMQLLSAEGVPREKSQIKNLGLQWNDIIEMYLLMVQVRMITDFGLKAAREGRITLFIGPRGQEAAEIASVYALNNEDWIFPYGRSWGTSIGRRVSIKSIFDYFCGNPSPECPLDFIAHRSHFPYILVGESIPHAVGTAWAQKIRGRKNALATAYFGDGATAEGSFHSSMNWAQIMQIPVIFFCENNQYAISTPPHFNVPTETIADRARGYNVRAYRVDGNDPFAVYHTSTIARKLALTEQCPVLVELETYRLGPHSSSIAAEIPVPEDELKKATREDPLRRFKLFLCSPDCETLFGDRWDEAKDQELKSIILCMIQNAFDQTQRELKQTLKKPKSVVLGKNAPPQKPTIIISRKVNYTGTALDALNLALLDIADQMPSFRYIGQDDGAYGGVVRTTSLRPEIARNELRLRGYNPKYEGRLPLQKLFPAQFIDSPLDEAGIRGVGVGLCLGGIKVFMEAQFSGFVGMMHQQIIEASRMYQRYQGLLPTGGVLILPFGAGNRLEYHREDEIPYFTNTPGHTIICPSSVQDFYDMTIAAAASFQPVLYFLHLDLLTGPKALIRRRTPKRSLEAFGVRHARHGTHVTFVSYGKLIHEGLAVAKRLSQEGISVEVLDLRVVSPLEKKKILASVRKTGRLITVQESPISYGIGAEIATVVTEDPATFKHLHMPVCRLGAPNTHWPPHPFREHYIPQQKDIEKAIRKMLFPIT